MSNWATSDRRATLPADWEKRRARVRRRAGGRCEAVEDGQRCAQRGSECDHVDDRLDHSLANLQWLCGDHHRKKTLAQATAARRIARAKARHPEERHPGLI